MSSKKTRDKTAEQLRHERNYADAKSDRVDIAAALLRAKHYKATLSHLATRYGVSADDLVRIVREFFQHRNPGQFKRLQGQLHQIRRHKTDFMKRVEFEGELRFTHAKAGNN